MEWILGPTAYAVGYIVARLRRWDTLRRVPEGIRKGAEGRTMR